MDRRGGGIISYSKRIQFFTDHADKRQKLLNQASVLVVGCGNGDEAICLQTINRKLDVIGLDIQISPQFQGFARQIHLIRADASHLPFRNRIVDFCYCYHALEHVSDYAGCVAEMSRVLVKDGELFLSTPNRKRLIGYFLSATKQPLQVVLRWNLREWVARMTGRFTPERGYHCGFTIKCLSILLHGSFGRVRFVTSEFTLHIAAGTKFERVVRFLDSTHLLRVIAPSHTVYCELPYSCNPAPRPQKQVNR